VDLPVLDALLLVLGGLAAGFLNVVAGGGSLITMPLLIFVGLPATSAIGTIRLAILVQSMTATIRYHRSGVIDWQALPPLLLPICSGTLTGALLATQIDNTSFHALVGWVTLAAGALVAVDINKLLQREHQELTRTRQFMLFVSLILVGFYAGLIQAGVGYLFLAALVIGAQFTLVQANVMKVVLVLCLTPITLLVFGLSSQIHLGYALMLTIGQALGAYAGVTVNLRKGASVIRPLLAIVVVAAALKLLFF